jgi:type 1 fimbria pilin
MRRNARAALAAVLAVGSPLAAAAVPAAARTTGRLSFHGQIIAVSRNGQRTVVSSIVAARGVFNGVGKIVEVPNRPGDPDNVSRDDLVFGAGTMHIVNINRGQPQISLDPQTCAATVRIKQTTRIQGGTRKFRHATGTSKSTVRAYAVLARNPDGSCNEQADALLDADVVSGRGTLSF